MAEYVKVNGSDSVYKIDGNTVIPIATPQAYALETGQDPNGPINWGAVKPVDPSYLASRQALPGAPAPMPGAPAPAPTAAPAAPGYNGAAYGPGSAEQARIDALMGKGPGAGISPTPTIDLPSIYNNLYNTSGIKESKAEYDTVNKEVLERQAALNTAKSKINDNPFYSEATRVGRIAKLEQIAQNDINTLINKQKVILDKIATSKADIETQINLQTKQFDINSAAAQNAFNQFNALLQAGALEGASGEDIANITRATGVSSTMIRSAIEANKKKNNPTQVLQTQDNKGEVTLSVIDSNGNIINKQSLGKIGASAANQTVQTTDDNGNVTITTLDAEGNIINKQSLGAVGPKVKGPAAPKPTAAETKAEEDKINTENLITSIGNKVTLRELVAAFGQALDIEDIYRLYNMYSPWGPAGEDLDAVKAGKFNS